MIRDEEDVLEASLTAMVRWFDRIYVLDGTTDPERVRLTDAILEKFEEVVWHGRDGDWFPQGITDGARQVLLQHIREDNGVDNWVGLLHADEFIDQDPRPMLASRHPSTHPSLRVRVAHTFLHTDDEERWDASPTVSFRCRVAHQMWPGVPESRFFFDDGSRDFDVARHSKVLPKSHRAGELVDGFVITQYNERSPEQVLSRARQRADSEWQVGHYARLLSDQPEVFVASLNMPDTPFAPEFRGDPEGPFEAQPTSSAPSGPSAHLARPRIETELTSPECLEAYESQGRVARNFSIVSKPGGILDLADRGSPRQLRRAIRRLRANDPFAHGEPVPGREALLRHTSRVVGSRRVSDAQRRRALAECVVRLCNAGAGDDGWYTVVPANRRGRICDFLFAEVES